jgi:type II secretory pathway predicted ATPase ExeA/septal ring-binding cell division protein DamX
MHVERNSEGTGPFQEKLNTAQFFTGGGREAVLAAVKAALQERTGIVTLIGEEGSGKTMLCKILQQHWDGACKVIFLPQTAKSFEDIVRVTAQGCDLQYPAETNRDDARRIFLELVASLRAGGESLLLICDEAEKMYLATLERLRKFLDDVNKDGGGLQLLFSGRESLAGHLEQLHVCDFEQVSEENFVLAALDRKDIWNYLNFCVQAVGGNSQQEVFTREAAEKIASMGMGNLWRINHFADDALRLSTVENSLLVHSDHVKESGGAEDLLTSKPGILHRVPLLLQSFTGRKIGNSAPGRLQQLPFPSRYLLGGAGVLCVLILFFVFSGDDKEELAKDLTQPQKSVVSALPVLKPASPIQGVFPQNNSKENGKDISSVPVRQEPLETVPEIVVSDEPVEFPAQKRNGKPAEKSAPVSGISQVPMQHRPVDISPVEIVEGVVDGAELPELSSQSKISPEKFKRIVVISKKQASNKTAVASATPGDPVLASLVAGGERWQTGIDDARFSIQLMALTSDQAEENLKRIVLEPEYQEIIDKLTILKRPSDPPVLLVFYGIYPSMAVARNARNNMPIFLRKHHPYAVSVRGAVEKARAE